jgi:hypothetical protein
MAGGAQGYGEPAPGDHLQTWYRLWLPGDQLEHGRAPWRDEYSFRPESDPIVNLGGWPYSLVYWPLYELFGVIVAWNLFVLITFVLAGVVTLLWLLELGLPRWAALAGALAFTIAPYRTVQSEGHLLGPISILLPLALFAFERAQRGSRWWYVAAGAALASFPLAGQFHPAIGAIPFFVAYAFVRTRGRFPTGGVAAALVALGIAVVLQRVTITGSISEGGRSLKEVRLYQADWIDFLSRDKRHGGESFVLLGWLTPILAAAGLVVLVQARRFALAALLGLAALIPILLAVGTNFPLYEPLWHAFRAFRYPRVPERLMPIACLAMAALVAFAVARLRGLLLPLAVLVALFLDLHVADFKPSAADEGNAAYAALRNQPAGRAVELPAFLPGVHYAGVYLYYTEQAPRQHPSGYTTFAPKSAQETARRLRALNCGEWSPELDRLGIEYVTVHDGLYRRPVQATQPHTSWFARRMLLRHGFVPDAEGGPVTLFRRGAGGAAGQPRGEPPRRPTFCTTWRREDDGSWTMTDTHAAIWIYGSVRAQLLVMPAAATRIAGREVRERAIADIPLRGRGWHLLKFDAPERGLKLERLSTSPLRG